LLEVSPTIPYQSIIYFPAIPFIDSAPIPHIQPSILTPSLEFYNHGANEQSTLLDNAASFSSYRLRPRVLVDVARCDTSTVVFGKKITFPLCASPAGLHRMAHDDGELATSRACAKKGVNMGISCFSNYGLEEVIAAAGEGGEGTIAHAIQLYIFKDRAMQENIIRRAERAGCKAILLTADSPVLGVRFSERRNDFRTPEGIAFPILEKATAELRSVGHEDTFKSFTDEGHSWGRDIPWLRSVTKMQIWIKGVLTGEDVEVAIAHGVDGVIVSNHGGRQLDGVPATLDALVECVKQARGRIPVHVDGGFRKGTDIFKAIALGADCCWVGRPFIWGLAVSTRMIFLWCCSAGRGDGEFLRMEANVMIV
jgi:(S)-2-hydroxy-acid oxidase